MRLTHSDLEATTLLDAEVVPQNSHQAWSKAAAHIRLRVWSQNRQDSTQKTPLAIPPDVIRVAKAPRYCRDDRFCYIGFHQYQGPLLILIVYKQDVIEMARALGALGFAFQEVLKGLFVVYNAPC
jgi:hypothetical protein